MTTPQIVAFLVALVTWTGNAVVMRTYFRHARKRTVAKTSLELIAFVACMAHLVTLAVVRAPSPAWYWAGTGLYVLANVVFWWALASHGKKHPAFAFIAVPPNALTTAGPYRLVRHPIYAAYLLAWIAGAVATAQPWLAVAPVCMSVIYFLAARGEEQAFAVSEFASAYQEYQRQTGMFVPKITALLLPAPRPLTER